MVHVADRAPHLNAVRRSGEERDDPLVDLDVAVCAVVQGAHDSLFSPLLPSMRFALAMMRAYALLLRRPLSSICLARALAFAAWLLSGIGYLRSPGRPKVDFFSFLRFFALSFAMLLQSLGSNQGPD